MRASVGALVMLVALACGSTAAPAGTPLSVSRLKFAVIDAVGAPDYCDPDFYPIARLGGEQASALAQYDLIKADTEAYGAIVAHEHLPSGPLDDMQELTVYRAWKLLRAVPLAPTGSGFSFQYRTRSATAYTMVAGTVRSDGVVKVGSRTATGAPNCPICLAASTMIGTPTGPVRVIDVTPGMLVWTTTADGQRVAVPVIETGSVAVPAGHMMVHLVLADGRELLASPGHRASDGRQLGTLAAGDGLDGSEIKFWELVPYAGERTYDILPAGATGHYWANGIELSSTLAN